MATLFVGVGGTGCGVIKTLAQKVAENRILLEQLRGSKQAAFWGIDADKVERVELPTFHAIELKVLAPKEKIKALLSSGRDPMFQKWWDPSYRTEGDINTSQSPGAGQIKLNGRFALYQNSSAVITSISALKEAGWPAAETQIYLVSSLFGGTGSGILFDVAYLLRQELGSQITMVLLEPSVLKVFDPGKVEIHAWRGAYASLLELDFWMANNENRSVDRQFAMSYRDGSVINEASAESIPACPVILIGGTDERGRSVAQTGQQVMSSFKEFIANVLYETAFSEDWLTYAKRNLLDSVAASHQKNDHGHSRGFVSVGLTYLRFPREKVRDYAKSYCLHREVLPGLATGKTLHTEDLRKESVAFQERVGVEEIEHHKLLRDGIQRLPLWAQLGIASTAFQNKVKSAKNAASIPERMIGLEFGKLEESILQYCSSLRVGGSVTMEGAKKQFPGFKQEIKASILSLLEVGTIAEMEEPSGGKSSLRHPEVRSLTDVLGFLVQLEGDLLAQSQEIEKAFKGKLDIFEKNAERLNLEDEYRKLRGVKNKLLSFGNEFDAKKLIFAGKLNEYTEGRRLQAFYGPVMQLYADLVLETGRWKNAVNYTLQRLMDEYGNAEEEMRAAYRRLRNGLFIYDEVQAGERQRYVYDLSVGDSVSVVEKEVMQERVIPQLRTNLAEMRKELLSGTESTMSQTKGLKEILEESYALSEKKAADPKIKSGYNQSIRSLVTDVVIHKVEDSVNAITVTQALGWQMQGIYALMRDLHSKKETRKSEYETAVGRMRAMFGQAGTQSLLDALEGTTDVLQWADSATDALLRSVRDMVMPLWRPGHNVDVNEKNKVCSGARFNVIFPRDWSPARMLGAEATPSGVPPQNFISKWIDDRIVFTVMDAGLRLSELDETMLAELEGQYYVERSKKLSGPKGRFLPYHSDFRFYNEWEWDLRKEEAAQGDRNALLNLSIGLVLTERDAASPLIARKKMQKGYTFTLSTKEPFEGKTSIKLGDSLAKAYETLTGNSSLRAHFQMHLKKALEYKIATLPVPTAPAVKEFIGEIQKNWQSLRPPQTEGKTAKTSGNAYSRSYYYWDLNNNWLSQLLLRVQDDNYRKLLGL